MTRQIAHALTALSRMYDTSSWVEPLDTVSHREKLTSALAAGRPYAPTFTYARDDVGDYLDDLAQVKLLAERGLGEPLRGVVNEELTRQFDRAVAIASGVDETYSSTVARIDGLPDRPLVSEAETLLTAALDRSLDSAAEIDAQMAAEQLRRALLHIGLSDWTVEVSDRMSASMSVNGPRSLMRVRSDALFDDRQMKRLLVHEVAGHVWRWHSARGQPEPLAGIPLGRTIPTEEGLALWAEAEHGLLDEETMRVYAARVVAVEHAQRHGLYEVAERIVEFVGPHSAAQIAMRAKRGLIRPSGPGGSTKDWSYLGGLRMCEAVAGQSLADIGLALSVKWSMDLLPQVRELAERGAIMPTRRLTLADLVSG